MEEKRIFFGDDERVKVRQLVSERKEIVESEKSDLVTLSRKEHAWEEISHIFNSDESLPIRTTVQLQEMWERQEDNPPLILAQEEVISPTKPSIQRRPSTDVNDVEVDYLPNIEPEVIISVDEPSLQRRPWKKGSKLTPTDVKASRVMRDQQFAVQQELHSMRMRVQEEKNRLLELRISHLEELLKLKKKKKKLVLLKIEKLKEEDNSC